MRKRYVRLISNKKFQIASAVFMLLIGIIFSYLFSYKDVQVISLDYGNDRVPIGEIVEDIIIKNKFNTNDLDVIAIDILFATYGRQNEGQLNIKIIEENKNETLFENTIDVSKLNDNEYKRIDLNDIKLQKNTNYIMKFTADGMTKGNAPTMWMKTLGENNKNLTINDQPVKGNLCVSLVGKSFATNKFIFFIFFFIILSSFLVSIIMLGYKNATEYIFRFRYLIAGIIFIICVLLKLHGSSLAMWNQYIPEQNVSISDGIILGKARSIRSDEWMVDTPTFFAQSMNKEFYPRVNYNLSLQGTNMLYASSPVYDITSIGKPFFWGFLLFGSEYGLSWYWCLKIILLFLFSYEMALIISNRNKKIAFMGACMITLSASITWWFSTPVMESVVMAQGVIVGIYHYFKQEKFYKKCMLALLILISAIGFVTKLYPPVQVPLAYLILIFLYFIIVKEENYKKIKKQDIFLLLMLLIIFSSISIYYAYQCKDAIINVMNTLYPGKRVSVGGNLDISYLFFYLFSWLLPFKDVTFLNNSEASSYLTLFPFIPFVYIFLKYEEENDWILKAIFMYIMFQISWFIITFPEWFAKVTLFSYVTEARLFLTFGLCCVYLFIGIIARLDRIETKGRFKTFWIVINAIFFIFLLDGDIAKYMGLTNLIISVIIVNIIIMLIHRKKSTLLVCIIIVITFITGAFVNPISNGVDPIYGKEVASVVKDINESEEGRWAAFNSIAHQNYLIMQGVEVYNNVNQYPDMVKWDRLDENKIFEHSYNRYAHIVMKLIEGETNFIINQPDCITININYEDLLTKTDIKYILSVGKLDTLGSEYDFDIIYSNTYSNIYIYCINR